MQFQEKIALCSFMGIAVQSVMGNFVDVSDCRVDGQLFGRTTKMPYGQFYGNGSIFRNGR